MDHRTYLKSLGTAEKDALTRRADAPGFLHLAMHGGLILFLGGLIALRVPFWWALMLPQGILLAFLFTLQHEATHKTPFASDRLNEWVGQITGLILVQPFLWFRYFHFAHHRWTNIPDKDPELASAKPEGWPAFLRHLSTVDYWSAKARVLWDNAFGPMEQEYLPQNARERARKEARLMLVGYALIALFTLFVSPILLSIWLIPLALGFPFLRLYLLAEHGRCPYVADMFLNTRTTFTNRVVRFLAWNMPYHIEHHAFPQVPFHRLPAFHHMIRDRLGTTSDGYAAFAREYVEGFQDQT
ncbi:MAG: fatty acid desaturase [Paracoccaceae bacterium]